MTRWHLCPQNTISTNASTASSSQDNIEIFSPPSRYYVAYRDIVWCARFFRLFNTWAQRFALVCTAGGVKRSVCGYVFVCASHHRATTHLWILASHILASNMCQRKREFASRARGWKVFGSAVCFARASHQPLLSRARDLILAAARGRKSVSRFAIEFNQQRCGFGCRYTMRGFTRCADAARGCLLLWDVASHEVWDRNCGVDRIYRYR